MKKIKKIVSLILAVTALAGLGTSCTTKKAGTGGKVELSVGNWPSTAGKSLDNYTKYEADFEADNPDIDILPDTWKMDLQTFYPKAEAGMLPNILLVGYTNIDKLIDEEYVSDITDKMKELGWYDMVNPKVKDLVSRDGKMYFLPNNAYALGIGYNTEMFEKAGLVEADGTPKQPKTWDEWAEFAVKIKEATGKPGIVFCTTNNCGGWHFTNLAWSYGVDFMEQDKDGKWKATFNTPECVEALQFIKDLRWKYDVITPNILVNQEEQIKTFATGGAGMLITAPDVTDSLSSYEMDPKDFGMVAIPAGPKKHVSLMGGNSRCLFNVDEAQIDAAFDWMNFVGTGYRFDDTVKENMRKNKQTEAETGKAIGIIGMSVLGGETEKYKYTKELAEEFYNMKPNAAKLYNESLTNPNLQIQPEEPVCAQDLYSVLDNCIQQVLNDKNADCKSIIEKANEDFQINYLNNVEY